MKFPKSFFRAGVALLIISFFPFHLAAQENPVEGTGGLLTDSPTAFASRTSQKYASIVRVENASQVPNYRIPWNFGQPSGGNGTGFLVGKNRFLTNAHVVSNSRQLQIKKVGDARPYPARILFIAHDCDLAMLEVEDYSAFENAIPFEIGELPQLESVVKVVGYPIGGERISVTSGVVSRIDFVQYSHTTADQHLAIQIDAAINPGNSGGPVLQDGKIVGVAFQGYSGNVAQNTGYMIPVPVINRFLTDIEDGSYDHYVDLAVADFPLLNNAQRKALGLPNDGIGVMVANADAAGSAGGKLQVGDVLLAIDGFPIQSNGLLDLNGESVDMNEIVERKFADEHITLTVWRDGQKRDEIIGLKRYLPYLMQVSQYDRRPRYTILGGLVFQPLDRNLMASYNFNDLRLRYLYQYYAQDQIYLNRPEVIVLTNILPDAVNSQLESFAGAVVDEINGEKVRTLAQAHDLLIQESDRDFIVIKMMGEGRPIVLEKKAVAAAQERIMSTYGIASDHYLDDPIPTPDVLGNPDTDPEKDGAKVESAKVPGANVPGQNEKAATSIDL